MSDKTEYFKRKKQLDSFKLELTQLLTKHKITLSEHCDYPTSIHDTEGICEMCYHLVVDGEKWIMDDVIGILTECIKK